VPRIVIIPAPEFRFEHTRVVGEALERHLDVIVAIDDDWRELIAHSDDADLVLKLKLNVLDAISGCTTGAGVVCPVVVLHRFDIELVWLAGNGVAELLSVKEIVRRGETPYIVPAEPPEGVKLLRLQTYKPLEHARFFDEQFENLEFEVYGMLHVSKKDVERWRRLTGASTLPAITGAVARAARRYVMELCVSGDYNACPGILLSQAGGRVGVEILKITSKPETNYLSRIDLAGLLASNR
jgi:hypothetical protein